MAKLTKIFEKRIDFRFHLESRDDDGQGPSLGCLGLPDLEPDVHLVVRGLDVEPVALTLTDRELDVVIALAHVLAVLEIFIVSN